MASLHIFGVSGRGNPTQAHAWRGTKSKGKRGFLMTMIPVALTACSLATVTPGEGGGPVAAADQQRCNRPFGRIVVVENGVSSLKEQGLPSVEPLLGVLARQSNCFFVAKREEQVQESVFREQQNMGMAANRLVGAEFSLVTTIMFVGNTGKQKWGSTLGGIGDALGAQLVPKWAVLLSQNADTTLTSDEAEVVLTLVENKSGLEIGASRGVASARDADVKGSLSAFWSKNTGGGTADAYEKTPAGRLVSAALIEGFNKLIATTRPALEETVASPQPASEPEGVAQPGASGRGT